MGNRAVMQELTMLEWVSDGKYKIVRWVTGRIAGYEKVREKIPGKKKGNVYRMTWHKYSDFASMGDAHEWYMGQLIRREDIP